MDQSLSKPGLCVVDATGKSIFCASLVTENIGALRLREIRFWLLKNIQVNIDGFALEAPSLNSTNRLFDLGEVSGVIKLMAATDFNIDPITVEPLVLKKFATGNAHSDKSSVLQAVKNNWGLDLGNDDDAADAFILAQMARGYRLGWAIFKRRHEAETMQEFVTPKTNSSKKPRLKTSI